MPVLPKFNPTTNVVTAINQARACMRGRIHVSVFADVLDGAKKVGHIVTQVYAKNPVWEDCWDFYPVDTGHKVTINRPLERVIPKWVPRFRRLSAFYIDPRE